MHLDGYFIVRDLLIPPAERLSSGFLEHGLLAIVSGKVTDRVQPREPGNGGERDFPALVSVQQPGAAEAVDRPQVLADLGLMRLRISSGLLARLPDHTDLLLMGQVSAGSRYRRGRRAHAAGGDCRGVRQ
jgi:hypothetical protein